MRRLLPILITTMLLPITFVTAQTVTREEVLASIDECRVISVDFMRAACLEAANRFLQENPELAQVMPAPTLSGSDAATPPIAQDPTPVTTADLATERAALVRERAEIEEARAALEAQSRSQSENERLGLLARLGLARNAEKDDEKIAATITIDRVTYNRNKIHTFYTSDGDVILQDPDSLRMRLPDDFPATATLERRTLGSKWLTFTDNPGRSYKVKVRDNAP